MTEPDIPARLRLRIVFDGRVMIGPGKADLLDGIAATGSIAAAGRRMGMSYKRAWTLVGTMNAAFREPVVASARGGPRGGGATLTETGRAVLGAYRRFEARAAAAGAEDIATIRALLSDIPDGK